MLRLFASRAAPALLRQHTQLNGLVCAGAQRTRAAGYCDAGAAGEGGEEDRPNEVEVFLTALDIDAKFAEGIEDFKTLLYDVKTMRLKKAGMSVKHRKKLLSHVEKYKQGLWAPKELR